MQRFTEDQRCRRAIRISVMRTAALLLTLLISAAAPAQELIIVEHRLPGFSTAMLADYPNRYSADLRFTGSVSFFPIGRAITAALMVGDRLFTGELDCDPAQCTPHFRRHDPTGAVIEVGPPFSTDIRSIRLSPHGELLVTSASQVALIDLASGIARATFERPLPSSWRLADGDVDSTGCTVALAATQLSGSDPTALLIADACGSELTVIRTISSSDLTGLRSVRFTADDKLIVTSRSQLQRLERDGTIFRNYMTPPSCLMTLTADRSEALLACEEQLILFDLDSEEVLARGSLHWRHWANSVSYVERDPLLVTRRRAVRH